jgi:hypothetical protein
MSVSEATLDTVDDTVESTELATRDGFHLVPRCRVCRNGQVRKKVNDLLAAGALYAMVLRALGEGNAEHGLQHRYRGDESPAGQDQ